MNLAAIGRTVRSALKGVKSAMSSIIYEQAEPWPAEPALSRYRLYRQWHRVFAGDHEGLWDPQRPPDTAPYVTVNLAASLTQTIVDRLWGTPPKPSLAETTLEPTTAEGSLPEVEETETVEAEDARQAVLTAIWEASKLDQHGRLAVETRSWAGDVALKAIYDMELNEVRVVVLDPEAFEGTWDDLDTEQLRQVVIATVLPGEQNTDWLFEEVHTPGTIENRLWELSKQATGRVNTDQRDRRRVAWDKRPEALADLEEFVTTGIDVIPVVLIPNRPTIRTRPYGRSDYAGGGDAIQRQLNWRKTQTNSILDKHEEAMMYGDMSMLEEHGQGKVWNCYQNKAIPLQQGEDPPGYVVYPGTTKEGQQEAGNLEQDFCKVSRVNPESIGLNVAGLPPSGRAIKLMQMNTTSTIDGHRIIIDPCLRRILSAATKLYAAWVQGEAQASPLEPGDIELDWSDGLPEDLTENVQLASMIKTSLLPVPDWRLIQMIYPDLSQEDAQAMADEFNAQQEAALEASFGAAQEEAGGSTEIGAGNLEETVAAQEAAGA